MKESIGSMLRHEALPFLMNLATTVKNAKERIRVKHEYLWESKQRLPASSLSVEETQKVVLGLGEQLKLLPCRDHGSVCRGDSPITDSLIEDCWNILRRESLDLTAFETASSYVQGTSSTAASVGASAAAAGMPTTPRKRSFSRVRKGAAVKNTLKGSERARVATFHPPPSRLSSINHSRSSDQLRSIAASAKGICKWQIDNLMDWMKENDYNPSPGAVAIADVVESTGIKPSQIATWAAEVGNVVAKLRNTLDNYHEVISINDDEDSVPELAEEEEEDVWNGLVADEVTGPPAAMPLSVSVLRDGTRKLEESGVEMGFDNLESLDLGLGFEFGDSNSFDGIQEESSITCGSSTNCEDEMFERRFFRPDYDSECEDEENFQRPPKRARSDSLDSLFALLD